VNISIANNSQKNFFERERTGQNYFYHEFTLCLLGRKKIKSSSVGNGKRFTENLGSSPIVKSQKIIGSEKKLYRKQKKSI